MLVFAVRYGKSAVVDLGALRAFEQRRILDAVDRHLAGALLTASRNRKELSGLAPPWEHTPPIWQLRVGDFRVFYDVDSTARTVTVRAIRRKGSHRTEEIL